MFDSQVYALRRKALFDQVGHPVVLFSNPDYGIPGQHEDSNFLYFTGISQPGMALVVDEAGRSILFVPRYREERVRWEGSSMAPSQDEAERYGFDEIRLSGEECSRFTVSLFDPVAMWDDFKKQIEDWCAADLLIGTVKNPFLLRFQVLFPELSKGVVFLEPVIARMRRIKSRQEIAAITRACDITALAQEAALYSILGEDPNELTVRAALEYLFTEHGAQPAFSTVVAGGKNATVLHHLAAQVPLKKEDLVIVDIGARFDGYCADITRTYPISGRFSERQRELYELVSEAQELVAEAAKPGMFLRNPDEPELSLHHLALEFFKKHNLQEYFTHGIGHYLGLDVHDVGSYAEPLIEGDVITIEPGLYLPHEGIGIRIEDDFWVVPGGAVCLSDSLPRSVDDVEELCDSVARLA
ncbi:MAG: Peptidase M24 [candidate division TM6 bacterium GW2011_GWF2_43_17]|nr:MAG: Peptidase M24 [candidate division TM6 bacterium GW2011_GWF2_43_17]HAU30154.1 hypothetical protein [Candidatus Dependentiae bacterium]